MRIEIRPTDPLSADAALARLLERAQPLPAERLPLAEAAGAVLARSLVALLDSPSFTNSARDGYAVRAGEAGGPLPSQGDVFAGDVPPPLQPGHCLKIMTGAPLPEGADAVVMKEDADASDPQAVRFLRPPAAGDWVRRQGEDLRRGDPLLIKGARLRPWEIALLAAQGMESVETVRRPRVAVLTTGGEVIRPGEPPRPGAVHDANGPALAAALRRSGAVCASVRHAPDDPKVLEYRLRRDFSEADVLLVTGGVSAGDRDHTLETFSALGGEVLFHRAAIRPGGPLLAGLWEGKWFFGLPGNPLSTLVCFEEFVLPVLETLQGLAPAPVRFPLLGALGASVRKPAGLRQFLFCRSERRGESWILHPLPQGSALVGSAAKADALAMLPEGRDAFGPWEEVSFRWLA